MTDAEKQKLQQEINEVNAKLAKIKAEFKAGGDFPKSKRSFSYRKSPTIKANDVCAL